MPTTELNPTLPAGLHVVCETDSGYSFEDDERKRLRSVTSGLLCRDKAVLERVESLVIPPMWKQVWVSDSADSYLQATGRDAKGRKQYIYHPRYVEFRQRAKFAKLPEFAAALPALRKEIQRQLRRRTWDKERILALMVLLMDQTKIRIGNERYEAENKTYGLTTLRRRHLKRQPGELAINFLGKSSKIHEIAISDKRLRKLLQEVSEQPGHRLFCYRCSAGKNHEVNSHDVNEYLHQHLGDSFSAKDFRTWGGTSLAVLYYPEIKAELEANSKSSSKPSAKKKKKAKSQAQGKAKTTKLERRLVKAVAKTLGNTPTVCREYYIHPVILQKAAAGQLLDQPWTESADVTALADYERYALALIQEADSPPAGASHPE